MASIAMIGIAQADTGSIKGMVKFTGEKPTQMAIDLGADKKCSANHTEVLYAPKTVVGENGEVQSAFVWIAKALGDTPTLDGQTFPAPEGKVVLDQTGCMFEPHVWAIRVGQNLEIRNNDDTLHNVHALPKVNKEFNLAMPIKGMIVKKVFTKPEMGVKFKCDVHPWMASYGFVMDHPLYAVSSADGSFEIKGVPAGNYGVSIWHPGFKGKGKKVTVEAGKDASLDFELSAGE